MPSARRSRPSLAESRAAIIDSVRALMLIRVYRVRGHLMASFDPLGLEGRKYHPELDPKTYGFTEADMDRPIFLDNVLGLETATLRQIVAGACARPTAARSASSSCTSSTRTRRPGSSSASKASATRRSSPPRASAPSCERLIEAEEFERFLHVKFTGTKRFGLDGGETTIPAIEQILKRASQLGVQEVVLGMAHRGRLNVLANIMSKPYVAIFSEFQGRAGASGRGAGLGRRQVPPRHVGRPQLRRRRNPPVAGRQPVAPGSGRSGGPRQGARQADAAGRYPAQPGDGHPASTATRRSPARAWRPSASSCPSSRATAVGGTIHFIINNQIGFTTSPSYSRSSPYCSDVAKMVQAPIFHVNGDDPEAVVHVARIATEFRQEFKRDVVIDMFCYRRFGHNEADEPSFTQPIMYRTIAKQPIDPAGLRRAS